MRTIIIEGNFSNPLNDSVVLNVFRPNNLSNPYSFSKTYESDFTETLTDLEQDTTYNIVCAGFATGEFELTISGDFENPNPIGDSFTNDNFNRVYPIHTV
jgi:hypothetical protein